MVARRRHLAWKHWLFIVHRWIGIGSCLLFVMWFASGLVMIYVPFPALSEGERLAGLEPIRWNLVRLPPPDGVRSVVLETRDGAPVWRSSDWNGSATTVAAGDGRLGPVNSDTALRIAAHFAHRSAKSAALIKRDQWTVAGGYDQHRPLWKVALAGDDGLELYVSSVSGAVVLDTTRRERFWNWLGSVPHWLYPTVLRQYQPIWRQVVIWISFPCVVGALTGMWIGILRTRLGQRRYRGNHTTPYHGWMLWHHVAGLVGGMFLTTWIISGWLSVDPGRLFESPGLSEASERAYARRGKQPPLPLATLAALAPDAKQVELDWTAGEPLLSVVSAGRDPLVLDARSGAPATLRTIDIIAPARLLVPGGRLWRVDRLTASDAYWYENEGKPRLPVLRLRFDDPARTWVHVDPNTGAILGSLDTRRRLYRWAFDLLHKWDFNVLTSTRPSWDILLWILSIAGLIISVSGVVTAWRRLTRRRSRGSQIDRQLKRI